VRIVIAGGTGFLGRALAETLAADRHDVTVLTRQSIGGQARAVMWNPNGDSGPWAAALDGADAVVNLAGESIGGRRWTAAQKQRILDSRLNATRSIVAAIRASRSAPPLLVNASAVGYYGPRGDEIVTETEHPGSDFLATVCAQWEAEAARAANDRTRVVCVRTGIVLDKQGGAMPQMMLPFRLGAGGPVGSGRQYWPWIHRADWIGMVRWLLLADRASGPFNATGPEPVTNAEFAKALGRAMHRPALLPTPGFILRVVLGEMADGLLLAGQRAIPQRAEQAGFVFRYRHLAPALEAIFSE